MIIDIDYLSTQTKQNSTLTQAGSLQFEALLVKCIDEAYSLLHLEIVNMDLAN